MRQARTQFDFAIQSRRILERTQRRAVQAVLAMSLATASPALASAQIVDPNRWTTDGPVSAMVRCDETIYIGGSFNYVGPRITGAGVPFDLATGAPATGFPQVTGRVREVLSDGTGGWYIAGDFTSVGDAPRSGLARVRADMTLSPWNPNVQNVAGGVSVQALALAGSTVFVGGAFTSVGGLPRNNFAAIDSATGVPTELRQDANGPILAMTLDGPTLCVGGSFTQLGALPRSLIAAVDLTTGDVSQWNPNALGTVSAHGTSPSVMALAVGNGWIYAAGNFNEIGSAGRRNLATLDPATGSAVSSWQADTDYEVLTVELDGSTLYVGGRFNNIGGQFRSRIAALDASSGAPQPWNPVANNEVHIIRVHFSTAYVGGAFIQIGGEWRHNFAALDVVTGAATEFAPAANSWVETLAVSDGVLYAGGRFTSMGGVARGNLAALDAETGMPRPWNQYVKGPVNALAVHDGIVYVGGEFYEIGGASRWSLAAVECATGQVTPWSPLALFITNSYYPGRVYGLFVGSTTAYVTGQFNWVGGASRRDHAAVDLATGYATSWNPEPNEDIAVLAPSGDVVYAGGAFTRIGGLDRRRIAALDASTGAALPWNPGADGYVYAIVPSDTTIYVGGQFREIGGQARKGLATLSPTTGEPTSWDPNSADVLPTFHALARSGNTVYLGGAFSDVDGQQRHNLAAVDAVTGAAKSWTAHTNGTVLDLLAADNRVDAAGVFTTVGGVPQQHMTSILDDRATTTLLSLVSVQAQPDRVHLVWQAGAWTSIAMVFRRTEAERWTEVGRVWPDGTGRIEFEDREVTPGTRYGYSLGVDPRGAEQPLGEAWVDVPNLATFALQPVRPNPSMGNLKILFSLPDASPARLELLDLAGRRLTADEVGPLGPGTHLLSLEHGPRLAPGVYHVRLTRGGQSLSTRAVIVP